MSRALIIHPHLNLWAGGEYIALVTAKALQENGYDVSIACEEFDVCGAERIWGMGRPMRECQWVPLPKTLPRLSMAQRAMFLRMVKNRLDGLKPDVVFNTQFSTYLRDGVSLAYHHGDLQYLFGDRVYYSLIRKMMNTA